MHNAIIGLPPDGDYELCIMNYALYFYFSSNLCPSSNLRCE